ncbi:MAG TPA: hypothetical protein VEV16_02485 [Daejeonella sp.]|nr:hypothetical protein [Daejeonella sp.]
MNTLKKFDLMEKISRELEDLKNSQTAVVQKIGKVEVDNMELGNKVLDRVLPEMHQNIADSLNKITEALQNFQEIKNGFGKDNNVDALRQQEALRQSQEGAK